MALGNHTNVFIGPILRINLGKEKKKGARRGVSGGTQGLKW